MSANIMGHQNLSLAHRQHDKLSDGKREREKERKRWLNIQGQRKRVDLKVKTEANTHTAGGGERKVESARRCCNCVDDIKC